MTLVFGALPARQDRISDADHIKSLSDPHFSANIDTISTLLYTICQLWMTRTRRDVVKYSFSCVHAD